MSGAFSDLAEIIRKRIRDQGIGFGAQISREEDPSDILKHVKSEDLIAFGFESEFVGRLPVRAVFERLSEKDLYEILRNPNNPIIQGKKLDFAAYGIQLKFDDNALHRLAHHANSENTGARGLVSAVERALLPFEKKLPSTEMKRFSATAAVIDNPEGTLENLLADPVGNPFILDFKRLEDEEKNYIKKYIAENRKHLSEKYGLTLSPSRIEVVAEFFCRHIMDVGNIIFKIKTYYDEIKKMIAEQ